MSAPKKPKVEEIEEIETPAVRESQRTNDVKNTVEPEVQEEEPAP